MGTFFASRIFSLLLSMSGIETTRLTPMIFVIHSKIQRVCHASIGMCYNKCCRWSKLYCIVNINAARTVRIVGSVLQNPIALSRNDVES